MLLKLAAGSLVSPEDPWSPPPYFPGNVPVVPSSSPWHRNEPCEVPTYDGFNQVVHPSVVDFGGKWNGYRWWMMITPLPTGLDGIRPDDYENPSLYASNDCVTWKPVGPQPIIPQPYPPSGYNSDPEMVWNPDEAQLEAWWRQTAPGTGTVLQRTSSKDGVTWDPLPATTQLELGVTDPTKSQSIVRISKNEWRMWGIHSPTLPEIEMRSASSPDGPWSEPVACTHVDMPPSGPWHVGVTRDQKRGILYMASMMNNGNIFVASSSDGIKWKWGKTPALSPLRGTWADFRLYRPSIVLHENGTHMRIWYSGYHEIASGGNGWKLGYAELPLSLWP